MFVVMRSDLSSILMSNGKIMTWNSFGLAEKSAKNFNGYAVSYELAVKLLDLQQSNPADRLTPAPDRCEYR